MGLLLLTGGGIALLLGGCLGSSPSVHSLHYLHTVLSEPSLGLPQFIVTAHLDGQLFAYYDSERKSGVPRVPWMEEMILVDTEYWDWLNRNARNIEQILKWHIRKAMTHYNHSQGFHIIQWVFGCELHEDGVKAGFNKFSYDGKEAISFDKDTLTWQAYDSVAEEYKRQWESEPGRSQRSKQYLEEKCINMLRRVLDFNQKEWQRKVAPEVKVIHKPGHDGVDTLVCHVHGFYPKEIDATWTRNMEVMESETLRGEVVPNWDGTYYTWLSIEIQPETLDQYSCNVEHDSQLEDTGLDMKQPGNDDEEGTSVWVIILSILGLLLALASIIIFFRCRQEKTSPATNEEMENMNPGPRRRRVCCEN